MSSVSSYTHAAGGPLRRRRASILVLAALLAAAAAALLIARAASPAVAAVNVSCGQTLTSNTVLANDLNNCPSVGLYVGAPGITINLNGHRIDGSGADVGVSINGKDKVVVTNGEIREFGRGVEVFQANGVQVKNLRVHDNSDGIRVREASAVLVTQSVVWHNGGRGINVDDSSDTRLTNNSSNSNSVFGIEISGSEGTTIQGNRMLNNGASGLGTVANAGGNTQLTGNVANGNGEHGLDTRGDDTVKLTKNTASHNGDWGIRAHPAAIDGGKNRAMGNGNSKVCENIVCSPEKGI